MALATESLLAAGRELPGILAFDSRTNLELSNRIREGVLPIDDKGELLNSLGLDAIWVNAGPNKVYAHNECLRAIVGEERFVNKVLSRLETHIEVDEMITVQTDKLIVDKYEKVLEQIVGKDLREFGVPFRRGKILFSMSDVNGILGDAGGGNHEEGAKKVSLGKPQLQDMTRNQLEEEIRSWLVDPVKGMGMKRSLYMNPETMIQLQMDVGNIFGISTVADHRLADIVAVPVVNVGFIHFPAVLLGDQIKVKEYLKAYEQRYGDLQNPHYVAGGMHWPLFIETFANFCGDVEKGDSPLGENISLQLIGERVSEVVESEMGERRRKRCNEPLPLDQRALHLLEMHVAGFSAVGMARALGKLAQMKRSGIAHTLLARQAKNFADLPKEIARPIIVPPTATYNVASRII